MSVVVDSLPEGYPVGKRDARFLINTPRKRGEYETL